MTVFHRVSCFFGGSAGWGGQNHLILILHDTSLHKPHICPVKPLFNSFRAQAFLVDDVPCVERAPRSPTLLNHA